jgi:hypothetical protein
MNRSHRCCQKSAIWSAACALATMLLVSAGHAVDCNGDGHGENAPLGRKYCHAGSGQFVAISKASPQARTIDLRRIQHAHDRKIDPDVPIYTDITLPGVTPELLDRSGREYALITLYNIDPPLEDLPSKEPGIDRGIDFRDPSNLLKSAYSNYVSPVQTKDAERQSVSGHPIGHFYVKVEMPGYPPVLTGMTTTARADTELVELTLGRQLGIGGVLLTPQPGRLNSAAEAAQELGLRQRELVVVDGLNFRMRDGQNIGPTYTIQDGNVVFARFQVPRENARDALDAFLQFVANGTHNTFGSLLSRPIKGDGAGCSAFAMFWLKGAGIIPFFDETEIPDEWRPSPSGSKTSAPLWTNFYNRLRIPWQHIGCDERVGLSRSSRQAAQYTVYDNLFHDIDTSLVRSASQGLAEKVRNSYGQIAGTLFQWGALTPLRDLIISSRRKDPGDEGDYHWAEDGNQGLRIGFWDNGRFSEWIKFQWSGKANHNQSLSGGVKLRRVKEGRFLGVEINALNITRASTALFERMAGHPRQPASSEATIDCRSLFAGPR